MSEKTILVTGADGFVGRHLLSFFRRMHPDARLIAAAQNHVGGWHYCAPFELGDLGGMSELIRETKPSVVIHLAAWSETGTSFANARRIWSVNVDGTIGLAEAVLKHAPECLFVMASSAEVYGLSFRDGHPLAEDAAMAPANPYGAAKAAADLAIGEMGLRGLRAVRLRLFTHVGPGQSSRFVLASAARQIAMIRHQGAPPILKMGAVDRWRDFLDVRDVCCAYGRVIECADSLPNGVAINVASGKPRKVEAAIREMLARSGLAATLQSEPSLVRPSDVEITAGDASRARKLLAWEPRIPWEDTLDSILADWMAREDSKALPA